MTDNLVLPKNMSQLAKDLVRNILVVDPNMRPEIADIKQHKFFRGVQWDLIASRKVKPPFVPPVPSNANSINSEDSSHFQTLTSNKSPVLSHKKSSKVLGDYHLQKINKVFKDF